MSRQKIFNYSTLHTCQLVRGVDGVPFVASGFPQVVLELGLVAARMCVDHLACNGKSAGKVTSTTANCGQEIQGLGFWTFWRILEAPLACAKVHANRSGEKPDHCC